MAVAELVEPTRSSVPPHEEGKFQEVMELCGSCGLELDAWQQLVLRGALGLNPDGKFAALEVGVCVSRQNGKGGILEARELGGLFVLGERTLMHTAHLFDTSLEAFMRMENLIEEGGLQMEMRPRGGISRAHGSEGFVTRDGRRLKYRSRTGGGARGFTGDVVILDEAMDLPEPFLSAIFPIISARSIEGNPQVWYTGSAVDQFTQQNGAVFARVRDRGIRGEPGLAWYEWSATDDLNVTPSDAGPLLLDREAWRRANPVLGIRIAESHVEQELTALGERGFAVERLGIGDWPQVDQSGGGQIALSEWLKLVDPASGIDGTPCFAYDLSPSRSTAAIAVAGRRTDGSLHVEIVEHKAGTGWVVPRMKQLNEKHNPDMIVADGPGRSLVAHLFQAGVSVHETTAVEFAQACGLLVDDVTGGGVHHLGTQELAAAIRGAGTVPVGDSWRWSRRKSSADVTPLVAATLALWAARQQEGGGYVFDWTTVAA